MSMCLTTTLTYVRVCRYHKLLGSDPDEEGQPPERE